MKRSIPILLLLLLTLLAGACRYHAAGQYTYHPPELTDDGLAVGTLAEVGVDTVLIAKAMDRILGGRFEEVHSVLVYKDDQLVLEEYFPGHRYQWDGPRHLGEMVEWQRDSLHCIQSDTKSITSLCVGIAIDEGFIQSADQSIFDYLPGYERFNTEGREQITIEHLLTMTSGLEGNEWTSSYANTDNPIIALWMPPCEDPITCILEKPLLHTPGTHFSYFGGHQILLGKIIENATGMMIDEFSRRYLFEPMNIDTANWRTRFPNGVIEAAGGLYLRPRDMLKIGVMMLNEGVWNDQRIVAEAWVEKSKTAFGNNRDIDVPGKKSGLHGYSYSWWLQTNEQNDLTIHQFSASGWGGQEIKVLPELGAVVVYTGGTFTRAPSSDRIQRRYLLPALAGG